MPNISAPEIILLLIVALLLFGAKRLPEIGRSLGTGMREFKDSVTGNSHTEATHTTHTQTTQLPVGTQDTTAPAPARENETVH
jgi:sec-independent protein translocase protein TatA